MNKLIPILIVALGLRLLLWAQPLHQPANDEIEYIAVARDLLAGHGWRFYDAFEWLRAPLYSLWLAGSLWLTQGDLHRAALPNIALSVANVWLCWRLTRPLAGERAALVAAALCALLWTNVTFASLYMAETLTTFWLLLAAIGLHNAAETRRWWVAALAGAAFGCATLTRSMPMLFVPLAALWLAWAAAATIRRPALRLAIPLLVGAVLTIAPWTARNALAYGRLIPVETGLSYNIWVFNEPRESLDVISEQLIAIPNPADRSDYAMAQGMARLREDPAILARKLWPNWVYLVRVKPIQDRFVQAFYQSDIGFPLFTAALVFDDALYLIIAVAALTALAATPAQRMPNRLRVLALLWLLYAIGTMLLTHGEARYRHFLYPALIPAAAVALAHRPRPSLPRVALVAGVAALIVVPCASTYPWQWAAQNTRRGWHAMLGDVAAWRSDWPAAAASYQRAISVQSTADGWLRLAYAHRQQNDLAAARSAYRAAIGTSPLYLVPHARYGAFLRANGQEAEARQAFAGAYIPTQDMTDWTYTSPGDTPPAQLDIGDGLDYGFVGGAYPAEQADGRTFRWTGGHGLVRLTVPPASTNPRLSVALAAPRPTGEAVPVTVCAADRCTTFPIDGAWRVVSLPVPGLPTGAPTEFTISSPTFVAPDGRLLGVLLDGVRVR